MKNLKYLFTFSPQLRDLTSSRITIIKHFTMAILSICQNIFDSNEMFLLKM